MARVFSEKINFKIAYQPYFVVYYWMKMLKQQFQRMYFGLNLTGLIVKIRICLFKWHLKKACSIFTNLISICLWELFITSWKMNAIHTLSPMANYVVYCVYFLREQLFTSVSPFSVKEFKKRSHVSIHFRVQLKRGSLNLQYCQIFLIHSE